MSQSIVVGDYELWVEEDPSEWNVMGFVNSGAECARSYARRLPPLDATGQLVSWNSLQLSQAKYKVEIDL